MTLHFVNDYFNKQIPHDISAGEYHRGCDTERSVVGVFAALVFS